MIRGRVPHGIGNLINSTLLGLEGNYLNGSLPESIGKLQQLQLMSLDGNKFLGSIPFTFGNMTSLIKLYIGGNRLEGSIPASLGNCTNLLELYLAYNNLNGNIPKEVISLSSLSISLNLAHNSLTGSIPLQVGNLKNLNDLDISYNKLSGEIPSTLGNCRSLMSLRMEGNAFQGTIPESLEALRAIEEIDFSHNNLSGQIPNFLGKLLLLKKLNLSHNILEGEVPSEGIFANASAISIIGNKYLCGGIVDLNLPACSRNYTRTSRKFIGNKFIIIVAGAILLSLLLCTSVVCYMVNRSLSTKSSSTTHQQLSISYEDLAKSTNGFARENMIGSGSFGSVYKGVLCNREIVAVKVINLLQQGASKSFEDECRALKNIKHRNLLKIITVCSSIDHQGNDFKALVSMFMSNGSLDQWLHPNDQTKSLNFLKRLNIAIDVASALEYLHHHCQTPIVHCDLKPSNVLLDDDMVAHVGDFGLASFLFDASSEHSIIQSLSGRLRGSIGYISPEIGMGSQVSTQGDVYSFGILLLEMLTGKRPTDEVFNTNTSIYSFVAEALPEHVMGVVDPALLIDEEEDEEMKTEEHSIIREEYIVGRVGNETIKSLVSVLEIGLNCASFSPDERLHMNLVVKKLNTIRDSFLRFKKRNTNILF